MVKIVIIFNIWNLCYIVFSLSYFQIHIFIAENNLNKKQICKYICSTQIRHQRDPYPWNRQATADLRRQSLHEKQIPSATRPLDRDLWGAQPSDCVRKTAEDLEEHSRSLSEDQEGSRPGGTNGGGKAALSVLRYASLPGRCGLCGDDVRRW